MRKHPRRHIPIGVLFSTTGPYSIIGKALYQGAMLAIDEVNADPNYDFDLDAVVRDPGGDLANYRSMCESLIVEYGVSHLVGCYTSSSRKELIPLLEKHDALLCYPSHYEGFECSPNVLYFGAAPNQHVVPLAEYLRKRYGPRIYCVGSNYIWPWECTRIFREIATGSGGEIVQERYVPMGDIGFNKIIQEIATLKPDVIFSTLIGESCYAFCREYDALRNRTHGCSLQRVPIASCTLSEPELVEIGEPSSLGHLTGSVYLASIDSEANRRFVGAFRNKYGANAVTSADAEAAYLAVHFLARALRDARSMAFEDVKAAVRGVSFDAPQGSVSVDESNDHCYLTPRIGMSAEGGNFEVVYTAKCPVRPDPYLVWFDQQSSDICS
jgi:ABC-type branched-subunit amino acid transport system substrate-binding protein